MDYKTLDITIVTWLKGLKLSRLFSKTCVVVSIVGGSLISRQETPACTYKGNSPTWDYPKRFYLEDSVLQQNQLMVVLQIWRTPIFLGGVVGISSGKSTQISMSPGEDFQLNMQKKDVGASNTLPKSIKLELPQLLSDLHALALDPFHGVERNSPTVTMSFFLRFRSLVYQKSLALSPPSETELVEVRGTKSSSNTGAYDYSASENSRGLTPSKPAKPLVRPDDPTKTGWKRLPSDHQEEIAAQRLKKIVRLKSLAAEKKAGQRGLDTQRAEGKESVATQRAEGKQPSPTHRAEWNKL